jgi:sialidase-1
VNVTQLFDLKSDPAETNNVAGDPQFEPELKRMFALLQREQLKAGDESALERDAPKMAAWTPPVRDLITNQWNGFVRRSFTFNGRQAFVTFPARAAKGNPWIWRMSFPDFHAEVDRSLLSNGWHVAHIDCVEMLGADAALNRFDEFHSHLVTRYRLNARPALEAVSRGGLHAYRYAARHPDRIACIYADTPVMDLKSWPLSWPGSGAEVSAALRYYGFRNEAELREWRGNPVDAATLKPIAEARIPLRHVVSLNDRVVPPEENTFKAQRRLEAMGHAMTVVRVQEGTVESHGHHFPLPEVRETVDFVMRHAQGQRPDIRP